MFSTVADARALDATDPAPARSLFEQPGWHADNDVAYFAGNSLGLIPRTARDFVDEVLNTWSTRAVAGHFEGDRKWTRYQIDLAALMAPLVGAQTNEVVVMNTLTVNLHVLLTAFFDPTSTRHRIVIEQGAFPSDDYAVASQLRHHGLDPATSLVRLAPRSGEHTLRTEDVIATLHELGESVAVVLLPGVNFLTGQFFDIEAITEATHAIGAVSGWDLAHAAGNVPVLLHDWNVDFAAWCTYKYLNGGPGSIGAVFVHQGHVDRMDLHRLTGWWGNNTATRFAMRPDFEPEPGAAGWQISNPPIVALAPMRAALDVFDTFGMPALRARSIRLTGYLEGLLDPLLASHRVELLTPREPQWRGAQLSLLVDDAVAVTESLAQEYGVVADERPPSIVRFAPIPLYTSYEDCWRAAAALAAVVPRR